MKKILLTALCAVLAGCASSDEPPYEIQSQQFYDKVDDSNRKIFAYVMSVVPTRKNVFNIDKPMSRREMKRFAEQTSFDESRALKLQLEDDAAKALKKELESRQYCDEDYKIDEVLWRDFSVQLRGYCL